MQHLLQYNEVRIITSYPYSSAALRSGSVQVGTSLFQPLVSAPLLDHDPANRNRPLITTVCLPYRSLDLGGGTRSSQNYSEGSFFWRERKRYMYFGPFLDGRSPHYTKSLRRTATQE